MRQAASPSFCQLIGASVLESAFDTIAAYCKWRWLAPLAAKRRPKTAIPLRKSPQFVPEMKNSLDNLDDFLV